MSLFDKKLADPLTLRPRLNYTFTQGVGAAFQSQIIENPFTQLSRVGVLQWGDEPLISPEQLEDEFGGIGLEFTKPESREDAVMRYNWKRTENHLNEIQENADGGMFQYTAQMASRIGASFLDPINLGASFIPVAGQAKWAGVLGKAGTTTLQRAGVRAGMGAIDGAVGGVISSGLTYASAKETGLHFGVTDLFLDVTIGSIMGSTLQMGAGGIGDVIDNISPATRDGLRRVALNRALTGDDLRGMDTILRQDEFFGEAEAFWGKGFSSVTEAVEGVSSYKAFSNQKLEFEALASELEGLNRASFTRGAMNKDFQQAALELDVNFEKEINKAINDSLPDTGVREDFKVNFKASKPVLLYQKLIKKGFKSNGELSSRGVQIIDQINESLKGDGSRQFLRQDLKNSLAAIRLINSSSKLSPQAKENKLKNLVATARILARMIDDDRLNIGRVDQGLANKLGFTPLASASKEDVLKFSQNVQTLESVAQQNRRAKEILEFRQAVARASREQPLSPDQIKRMRELASELKATRDKIVGTGAMTGAPKPASGAKMVDAEIDSAVEEFMSKLDRDSLSGQQVKILDEGDMMVKQADAKATFAKELFDCRKING